MSDDNEKGFLLKAVSDANPEAKLTESDRAVVRLLDADSKQEEV